MNNKEKFKEFVKSHPTLVKYVRNNEMTWQKFYEMYDLYGEENDIWNEYIKKEGAVVAAAEAGTSLDFMSWLKNIDLDALQDNINSVRRVVGVLQDFGSKDSTSSNSTSSYKPRPLYKHFED